MRARQRRAFPVEARERVRIHVVLDAHRALGDVRIGADVAARLPVPRQIGWQAGAGHKIRLAVAFERIDRLVRLALEIAQRRHEKRVLKKCVQRTDRAEIAQRRIGLGKIFIGKFARRKRRPLENAPILAKAARLVQVFIGIGKADLLGRREGGRALHVGLAGEYKQRPCLAVH